MTRLKIKVVPGARQNRVVGRLGDALKVQVAAPPEKGKANQAVIETLASFFEVLTSNVEVLAGHTSVRKVVVMHGVTQAQVDDRMRDKLGS